MGEDRKKKTAEVANYESMFQHDQYDAVFQWVVDVEAFLQTAQTAETIRNHLEKMLDRWKKEGKNLNELPVDLSDEGTKTRNLDYNNCEIINIYKTVVFAHNKDLNDAEIFKKQHSVFNNLLTCTRDDLKRGIDERVTNAPRRQGVINQLRKALQVNRPDFICMQEGQRIALPGYYRCFDRNKPDCSIYAKSKEWKPLGIPIVGGKKGYPLFEVKKQDVGNYYSVEFTHDTKSSVRVVSMHLPTSGNTRQTGVYSYHSVYDMANKLLHQLHSQNNVPLVCGINSNTTFEYQQQNATAFGNRNRKDHDELSGSGLRHITFFPTQGPTVHHQRGYLQFKVEQTNLDVACKDVIGFKGSQLQAGTCCRWAGKKLPPDGKLASLPTAGHCATHAWLIATVEIKPTSRYPALFRF